MNKKVLSLNDFVQRHNLVASKAIENESSAIYWIHQAYLGISSVKFNQEVTSDEAVILQLMIFKLFQHVEASIVAFVTGSKSSACVISRTATELAMSIIYILKKDTEIRLVQYLLSPMREERERLEKLAKSNVNGVIPSSFYLGQVNMLDLLEKWCQTWANHRGISNLDKIKNWPDIFRVFEQAGYEFQYRTAYSVMSTKTHNKAHDLLQLISFSDIALTSNDGTLLNAVVDNLMITERMILYSGIIYALEATHGYASYFQLNENIIEPLNTGKEVISAILSEMAMQQSQVTEVLRD